MNTDLLVCDPLYYRVDYEINPYMHQSVQPDSIASAAEHVAIVRAHAEAGRSVRRLAPAPECPDMVFTANTAVVRGGRAVLGQPPPQRKAEIPYVAQRLVELGLDVVEAPYPFSGQGDALACGDLLLCGHGRRTDGRMLPFLGEYLDCDDVVPLRTVDDRWYDLDLALAVIDSQTLAYHGAAFDAPSLRRLHSLDVDLVEVGPADAAAFALNLVSDGTTVTMTSGAPWFARTLRERGLQVVELDTAELRKGGGGVRCTALSLDSPERPAMRRLVPGGRIAGGTDAATVLRPAALVYRGPASTPGCPEAVAEVIASGPWGLDVHYVGPEEDVPLGPAALDTAVLYAQPGGGSLTSAYRRLRRHRGAVRAFVARGGGYLGFCLGGYLAGATPGFGLLPGDADRYIGSDDATVDHEESTLVQVRWRERPRTMFFQDGPLFVVDDPAPTTILARYPGGAVAAMIAPFGRGRVGVVGPHPEATPDWFTDTCLPVHDAHDLAHDLVDGVLGSTTAGRS